MWNRLFYAERKAEMALKTQGTELFLINPDATGGAEVVKVGCITSIDGVEATRDQLETTCLDSAARTYEPGMATPGQMTFGINFDPEDESHVLVYDLWKEGKKLEWAIGLSDGTAAPTVGTDDLFDLPTTRSFVVLHDAYVANVPLSLALNALVNAQVALQMSGFPDIMKKA